MPVPYTDRYEIKIEQTFETHVPVPVLTIDPPNIDFGVQERGFEAEFTATLTNSGLIKVRDIDIEPMTTADGFLQPLITYLPELGPFESVEIPYRFVLYEQRQDSLPGVSSGLGPGGQFLDCLAGGFIGNAENWINFLNAIKGLGLSQNAGKLLQIATGLLVFIQIYNAIGIFTSAADFAFNALACAIQAIGGGFGYGIGGGGSSGPGGGTGTYIGGGPGCFAADTPVIMADGSLLPIQEIRVGDHVITLDGNTAKVTKTYQLESDHIIDLRYQIVDKEHADQFALEGQLSRSSDFRLNTTAEHLFWKYGTDWVPAGDLRIGDQIAMEGGVRAEINDIQFIQENTTVYNFDVEGYQSYLANYAIVHQKCGGSIQENELTMMLRDYLNAKKPIEITQTNEWSTGNISPVIDPELSLVTGLGEVK